MPLTHTSPSQKVTLFLAALKNHTDFEGIATTCESHLAVHSTDNSIYELKPKAVIYPKNENDIRIVLALLQDSQFVSIAITAKGGGTSTNGQCLAWKEGLILDTSRFMNRILKIDTHKGYVRVQSGVVLGKLNEELAEHGYMFAPTTSTNSRVTLGGMISTNASGIGSRLWGRTSDHLKSVRLILLGGEPWDVKTVDKMATQDKASLRTSLQVSQRVAKLITSIYGEIHKNREHILRIFQKMPRSLTGYQLNILNNNSLHLPSLIAGSEGTLGIISECTLAIVKKPKHKLLLACVFARWDACLKAGEWSVALGASAVEALDSSILTAARSDISWQEQPLAAKLEAQTSKDLCVQLIEFQAHSQDELHTIIQRCNQEIEATKTQFHIITWHFSKSEQERLALWNIRKKAVGLFAYSSANQDSQSTLRSCAFVEDAAVHPHDLPKFIQEFGAILDKHKVSYGMYGHLDAGCMHVRPKLDTADPAFTSKIRQISEAIKDLSRKYGGVLWGEHGKGLRSEYTKEFFGHDLYNSLQTIKTLFDPHYQLNPGKICPPLGYDDTAIPKIDAISMRKDHDNPIPKALKDLFAGAYTCDGNGVCFSVHTHDVMCPSFRATGSRIHSPKGRAAITKAWIKQHSTHVSTATEGPFKLPYLNSNASFISKLARIFRPRPHLMPSTSEVPSDQDITHHLYHAMHGCLACRACSSTCPLKVDIPELKSRFLNFYHTRYPRTLRDLLIAASEDVLPRIAAFAPLRQLYNFAISKPITTSLIEKYLKLSDPPLLHRTSHLNPYRRKTSSLLALAGKLPPRRVLRKTYKPVVIVEDLMTQALEKHLLTHLIDFLKHLGFSPYLTKIRSGKPWHLRGYLKRFQAIVHSNHKFLSTFAHHTSIPLVGIDPAFTFTYRSDYPKYLKAKYLKEQADTSSPLPYTIHSPQEYLGSLVDTHPQLLWPSFKEYTNTHRLILIEHCFERTTLAASAQLWQKIFAKMDLSLEHKPMGCCGMAGFFGHEREHVAESKDIFRIHWQSHLQDIFKTSTKNIVLLITGGSCRSQVKRCFVHNKDIEMYHPLEWLGKICAQKYTRS